MTEVHSQNVRVAPHSKESEMMVLGCMLTSVNALNISADALDDSDFYFSEHKIIFQVLKNAYRNDKPADIHLVSEELKRQGKLSSIGGVGYITTLAQYAGTSAYIEEYSEIVKNKALLRKMIHAAQVVEKSALDDPPNVSATLDDAQALFFQISQSANPAAGVLIKELLSGTKAASNTPFLKELQLRQEAFQTKGPEEKGITGVPTHFVDIDKMLDGLGKSNLIIIAARPAMGKSAFAINIAENICFKNGMPVGIFSLEMSSEQLLHRIICSQSEVISEKIKNGSLNGMEYQRIVAAVNNMLQHTMIIDDQPGLKITDLRARARRMKESHNIELLIVDYLQLLSGSGSNRTAENRQNEISEISRMLKNLARELDIPIICLSQLSRKVEERQGHRPMMSDLRESGCLAGDTLIKDAETGELYTIKNLAERTEQKPIKIYAVDDNLKITPHLMTKVFYSGKKVVYLLKTRTGRTVKASANHPFLKLEGWTPLEHLKRGDRIALPRKIQSTAQEESSRDELALLAHLLGDGCILPKQPYHYTSADPENIQIVSQTAHSLFGISPKIVNQKNWSHVYLPSPFQLTHNKKHPITLWYETLGIERVRSFDKSIPKSIFLKKDADVAFFLHHLFATDGNISWKKLEGRKTGAAIYYASSSKILSQQVQHLLLSLGIQSSLKIVKSSKGYRDMHHVIIQGCEHQIKFLKQIGCFGQRGKIIPEMITQLSTIKAHINYDVIPKEAWQSCIKEAKKSARLNWREIAQGLNTSYSGSSMFKSGISRSRMEKLTKILNNDKLSALASSDVYWDEIISIEQMGVEDVYDATVPGVHNFVANDIIVHNSIEQDADVVIFLLRREYYDPMDKPGMAEVIVAKNRHGGIGNVNLTFRKEIAQFVNYTPMKLNGSQSMDDDAFKDFSP